jgi:16S rRNA U516 pseudouridylate synthase RsuA-like enzyme
MQVLANAGIASKRASEDFVTSGAVRVNGLVVSVPQHMVLLLC